MKRTVRVVPPARKQLPIHRICVRVSDATWARARQLVCLEHRKYTGLSDMLGRMLERYVHEVEESLREQGGGGG